jgi:hypothetical protein
MKLLEAGWYTQLWLLADAMCDPDARDITNHVNLNCISASSAGCVKDGERPVSRSRRVGQRGALGAGAGWGFALFSAVG